MLPQHGDLRSAVPRPGLIVGSPYHAGAESLHASFSRLWGLHVRIFENGHRWASVCSVRQPLRTGTITPEETSPPKPNSGGFFRAARSLTIEYFLGRDRILIAAFSRAKVNYAPVHNSFERGLRRYIRPADGVLLKYCRSRIIGLEAGFGCLCRERGEKLQRGSDHPLDNRNRNYNHDYFVDESHKIGGA